MVRRFEFVGGSSAKFWEVDVAGVSVTIRYGRLGTEGQRLVKPFSDVSQAQCHAEKLIAEKLGKGYRECAAT